MCDYSLQSVKNRPAKQGEALFVNLFHSGSKGLASAVDFMAVRAVRPAPEGAGFFSRIAHQIKECKRLASGEEIYHLTAVCVPPGARLYVEGVPKALREQFGVREAEEVLLIQFPFEECGYRDAFLFGNGEEALIQQFPEGLRVAVLALALEEEAEVEELAPANLVERGMSANA